MRLPITYTLSDNTTHTVVATPAVIMAWERRMKTKVSKLSDGVGMEDLLFMAWEASRFAGRNVPSAFDDFAPLVVEIQAGESEVVTPFPEVPSVT